MSNPMLMAGAQQMMNMNNNYGWQTMSTAPRDGTVIELKCNYGVAPWYGIYKFAEGRWQKASDPMSGIGGEDSFFWRPYSGSVESYSDPTGGMQNDSAYWRGSVAAKYGLPLDAFEAEAARNEARNKRRDAGKLTMWDKLSDWFG